MSARNALGDAVAALVILVGVDPAQTPDDLEALRTWLQRAALEEEARWDRVANASTTHDYDASIRARRWARAIETAWSLARHEIDVALGRRRSGA